MYACAMLNIFVSYIYIYINIHIICVCKCVHAKCSDALR